MPRKVEISHKTIIFTILLLISFAFLYLIRDILFQFFVAIFIMVVLNPTVRKFHRSFKIPRAISVLIVYFSAIGLIAITMASIVPALVEQTTNFAIQLPRYVASLGLSPFISDQINNEILSLVGSFPSQVIRVGVSIFSNVLEILTVLIFAFYLLLSRDKLDHQLAHFLGEEKEKKIANLIDELEVQLGGWARGELALMFLVGSSTYVGLALLGIPYAIPLAVIAGLLEAVPYLGPIMAAVPAVIIGFGNSPVMGFATIALAFLIQQIENYVFVPKVMERSVGISPIVTLLSLSIGFRLAGVGGVLMSVPAVIAARVFIKQYLHK